MDGMHEFVESWEEQGREDPPAAGVASRTIEPGREGEFEEWISAILAAVRGATTRPPHSNGWA